MAIVDQLRLIGSPDTNKVMTGELSRLARRALGRRPPEPKKQGRGALLYPWDPELARVAVGYLRTATRVLWDLYESRAERLEPLYDELLDDLLADDRPWYWDGARISVRARNVAAFAAGERQIVGTVKNAILDGAAARGRSVRVDPERPDILITVRMHDEVLSVSIDLGGESLSQRGYRAAQGAAPLREHLAAVLLMLARHDPRTEVLLDPMCGAGTICIEAVHMARAEPLWTAHGTDPGEPGSEPAMLRLPMFRDLDRNLGAPQQPLFADTLPVVIGNDIDPAALAAARTNMEAAGLQGRAAPVLLKGDVRALTRAQVTALCQERGHAGESGLILSNPPYGHRLSDRQISELYQELGRWCQQFRGWRAAFLVASDQWEWAFGHRPRIKKPLKNGPLNATFYLYDL